MKKIWLLLLIPFLLSTQCEEDIVPYGYETGYILENRSGTDLYLKTQDNTFVEVKSQAKLTLGTTLNSNTQAIAPSDSYLFTGINLYQSENENFILVYSQDPIDDAVWGFMEPEENRYEYTLTVTDNDL
ncbi:hypothetical protein OZ410_02390 [Robiginitalea sp. M366]|uniref:hypothetical protein n=1 Tax=Robiginitalea aestuariiviva TaxID=3036903 RepID=UPI00240D8A5E|nr:hypothetical protein [Robiginitalea aestuariiviva]MDG1571147.1 hypothetical protein [Robiginitalea aestuariiviva]